MRVPHAVQRLGATCGALALALVPHLEHLPAWISAALAGAIVWRLAAEQRGWALPPRVVRLGAALAATLGVLASYRTLNGLDAGTALLTVMAALKLTETRAPRDQAVLVFIGYFLCLASLLYGQSFARFAWALVVAWLLTAALARAHRPPEANTPVRPFRLAGRLLLLGAPLALILFLFVPRLEGRIWSLPQSSKQRSSGLNEEMSPGDVAQLALSEEPAFRVWFSGATPPAPARYWRVLVLENFDGRSWRRAGDALEFDRTALVAGGTVTAYRVALEPTGRDWLPGLDTVVDWAPSGSFRTRGGELIAVDRALGEVRRTSTRFSYQLRSDIRARVAPALLPREVLERDLYLPPGRAPRARAYALAERAKAADSLGYIERILGAFARDGYAYTLEPAPLGEEPVDEFLFQTREGFCEHYASAFAVLMRAAGIPTRVVIGYQGGELNGYGGYLLVRQSSAHAWNEVWLPGRGWMRVDPTAAVAPDRVRRGGLGGELGRSAGNLGLFAQLPWLENVRAAWDAARTAWYDSVVSFDRTLQLRILDALGFDAGGWQGLAIALAVGLALAAVSLAAWLAWELRPLERDPLAAGWRTVSDRLAARGLGRAAAEGPLDYGRRVSAAAPTLAAPVAELVESYVAARYLPGAGAAEAERFLSLVRDFGRRLARAA